MTFQVKWNEDSTATVLGRITARNGSGVATGIAGEGKWLQQADVDSITYKIFDLNSATPDTPIKTATATVSTVVLDTVVTSTEIWTKDAIGYNFLHDLAAGDFPTGDRIFVLEYVVTLTGGAVFHGVYRGPCKPIRSS